MNHITHLVMEYSESLETVSAVIHSKNFSYEHLAQSVLSDLKTQGSRMTEGICQPITPPMKDHSTNTIRSKRQIASAFLLLTTIGSFLTYIIPSFQQQIQPDHLSIIKRHIQTIDEHITTLDD